VFAPWVAERLSQERRLFYGAFTRAKRLVILISGDSYRKPISKSLNPGNQDS
jgi:ATP-dependent exoDNAse (exonuclease V) beta subunit